MRKPPVPPLLADYGRSPVPASFSSTISLAFTSTPIADNISLREGAIRAWTGIQRFPERFLICPLKPRQTRCLSKGGGLREGGIKVVAEHAVRHDVRFLLTQTLGRSGFSSKKTLMWRKTMDPKNRIPSRRSSCKDSVPIII